MTIVIDKDTAFTLLKRAVEEKGEDYIDPNSTRDGGGCRYATRENGEGPLQPSCIVGHVLFYAGVDEDTMWLITRTTGSVDDLYYVAQLGEIKAVNEETGSWENYTIDLTITEGAADVFRTAQMLQDDGRTWGEALERAKGVYEGKTKPDERVDW